MEEEIVETFERRLSIVFFAVSSSDTFVFTFINGIIIPPLIDIYLIL